jgi:hypothetical protein
LFFSGTSEPLSSSAQQYDAFCIQHIITLSVDAEVSLVSGLAVIVRHSGEILDEILKFQIFVRREILSQLGFFFK